MTSSFAIQFPAKIECSAEMTTPCLAFAVTVDDFPQLARHLTGIPA
jgi:hypothetical protein